MTSIMQKINTIGLDKIFEVSSCPICDSNEFTEMQDHKITNNRYVAAFCKDTGLEFSSLEKNLQLTQCCNCKIFYYRNYFVSNISNYIYNHSSPVHGLGWHILERHMDNKSFEGELQIDELSKIYNFIIQENIPFEVYAEFNCPFLGLIPKFMTKEDINITRKKFLSYVYNSPQKANAFMTNYVSRHEKTLGISSIIKKFYFLKYKFKDLIWETRKINDEIIVPNRTFLIKEATSNGWDFGCALRGVNCKSLITNITSVQLSTMHKDIIGKLGSTIDLILFSQTLDHSSNPLSILRQSMQVSKNILIYTHGIEGGVQHRVFIDFEFIEWVCKERKEFTPVDLTDSILGAQNSTTGSNSVFLIRRDH